MPRAPVIPPVMTDFSTQICRDDVLKFEKLASKTAVEVREEVSLKNSWNNRGISMEYAWNKYGWSKDAVWKFVWIMYGICMD